MDTASSNPPSEPSNDIFSLSDQVLSERLEFVEEIGFGNWGSVWLCRPKPATSQDGSIRPLGQKIAVKLVHRSKTSTTAARVRSLWNEMKIIKSLKEPHPSIIPFHSFIITPSYALITMSYLPTLVPVEVEESKAREWFRFLLAGVEFLHARGVVHNDIKPANILLSHKNIPVLVDFGFAEKYDMDSDTAFHSNLSYGTPEYLSPERARGLPHDTRKSDIWSLGVTFFEILVGRTPFEKSDGEQFNSKEDLEKYWERTLRGKWVGTWEFSKGIEKLLQRMMSPNADLRCNAKQANADVYWQIPKKDPLHKRASSYTSANSSMVFEKDMEKLLNMTPSSWKGVKEKASNEKEVIDLGDIQTPPGLDVFSDLPNDTSTPAGEDRPRSGLARSKSQPKVAASSKLTQPRKRVQVAHMADLSPIKASPNPSPAHSPAYHNQANTSTSASAKAKENISTFNKLAATVTTSEAKKTARTPFGALNANAGNARPASMLLKKPSGHSYGAKAVKVLGDLKAANSSVGNINASYSFNADVSIVSTTDKKESTNVKDRVKEWEREKERLREMERLGELERERDEIYKRQKKERRKQREREKKEGQTKNREESLEKENEEEVVVEKVELEEQERQSLEHEKDEEEVEEREHQERVKERKDASHMHIRIPGAAGPSTRPGLGNHNSNSFSQKENKKTSNRERDYDKENFGSSATSPVLPMFRTGPPLTQVFNISMDTPPPPSSANRLPKGTKGSFKHSIKASIDKTIEFCKSASLAQVASGRSTPARGFSFDVMRPSTKDNKEAGTGGKDGREAWELEVQAEGSLPEISPLPVIKNAADSEKIAADARMDRMAFWMRNVEKVVEEAKQNFASASVEKDLPLPPLPAPLSRNTSQNRTSRLPRRVLAASQIFHSDENGNISPLMDQSMVSNNNSAFLTANEIMIPATPAPARARRSIGPEAKLSAGPSIRVQSPAQVPEIHTPARQRRRATISISSPAQAEQQAVDAAIAEVEASPSKRKEKSKSQSNIFQMHIAPISLLEAELNKIPPPEPTPRLSQIVDRNLFIAPPLSSRDNLLDSPSLVEVRQPSFDELTSSPYRVEPYPQRNSYDVPVMDTPSRHRIEGVYDRFLMATTGVKRLGKGYQSETMGHVGNTKSSSGIGLGVSQNKGRPFYSTRRPMPPPVSSDDLQRMTASVDELGNFSHAVESPDDSPGASRDANVGFVRKAIKLMVPKATNSKRMSRII